MKVTEAIYDLSTNRQPEPNMHPTETEKAQHTAEPIKTHYPAKLLEGNSTTTRIVYNYRDRLITGRFGGSGSSRTVSSRREWRVDGIGRTFGTLSDAKAAIDAEKEDALNL